MRPAFFKRKNEFLAWSTPFFEELRQKVASFRDPVMHSAKIIAKIDALLSLALVAQKNHYIKPIVDESSTLKIDQGRHPIFRQALPVHSKRYFFR